MVVLTKFVIAEFLFTHTSFAPQLANRWILSSDVLEIEALVRGQNYAEAMILEKFKVNRQILELI